MRETSNFLKCPHYSEQPCPGEKLGIIGRDTGGDVVYLRNGKPISGDMLDFIKEHHCGECPKNER